MEEKNKKRKIIVMVVILFIIAIIGIATVCMNKKEKGSNTINDVNTSQNQLVNETNTQKNGENSTENETEPKDPVDEKPANFIATPTEEQKDQVSGSNPTR